MSNYTKTTNFATKDNLSPGNPLKIVKGTEIDTEFNNIATAVATKTDNSAAAITGGTITGITDLAVADGGTGASTAAGALNNLLPSQTSAANKYLQSDGTNASWDAVSLSTADITGTLAVANGGTGVTSSTGTGSVVLSNSPTLVTPALGTPASGTATNLTGLPISTGVSGLGTGVATLLATPSSANLASAITDETGSGALVFATSPTLVTPVLGTPASGTLTNATGLPISTGVSGLGTGVATFLATPSSANLISAVTDETGTGSLVFATSPTLVTPALGTPSALVGTNITGTASGLTAGNVTTNANLTGAITSTGNATSLGSFSSANLLGALTDETGTGSAVFATSPTLVTPILGTPTSATLTNATGLPLTTGVTGTLPVANGGTGTATPSIVAGTNVTVTGTWPNQTIAASASGGSPGGSTTQVQYNNAGAFGGITGATTNGTSLTLVAPVLGTPASGVVTNLTGTASININGTVGATTANTGAFTSLTASTTLGVTGVATFSAGTAALPAITTTGDTNTGIFFPAADTIAFSEGGAEAMRIDSSGRLGLGVTPTGSWNFQVTSSSGASRIRLQNSSTGSADADGGGIQMEGTTLVLQNSENGPCTFEINGSERARIDTSGNFGIGTSSPSNKLDVQGTVVSTNVARIKPLVGSNDPTVILDIQGGNSSSLIKFTNGGGITFPATQVASTDANTLDDYEEGTWTPTVEGTGSNPTVTYNVRVATYVKIGKTVFVYFSLGTGTQTGGTGNLLIGGLPFTASGSTSYINPIYETSRGMATGRTMIATYIDGGGTKLNLLYYGGTSSGTDTLATSGLINMYGIIFYPAS